MLGGGSNSQPFRWRYMSLTAEHFSLTKKKLVDLTYFPKIAHKELVLYSYNPLFKNI